MLDFVFEDGFGFERYVDYLLDVPMYFAYRNGEYIDLAGQIVPRFHGRQTARAAGRDADAEATGPTT